MEENLVEYRYKIKRAQRRELNGHGSFLVLFTGLSGSGKSTVANTLEKLLFELKIKTYVLDGDNIRRGINQNLGFSPEDRSENNRRIAEISKLFIDAGCVVLAAFVSPYKKDRENIKQTVGADDFFEVFVNTSIEECERRDTKGLYKKARAGEITNMTGISAPYETPENPDIVIFPAYSPEESAALILEHINHKLVL
ncbi:adenylyl-sulfate kinase [Maribacter algarum]|uniref:Adenylyl-sulfate kinase n=1 Tax=Maribacter algarum (ex Zhang et al. 2020) TaxID=2578118 RepID=A0A5S3Q0M0_9FLAO|nr:adenylyl-sulfate kinase [Maribacter algarum]TMM59127.1 adenylyl-sulfate kinase [Maribacter algarum]